MPWLVSISPQNSAAIWAGCEAPTSCESPARNTFLTRLPCMKDTVRISHTCPIYPGMAQYARYNYALYIFT
jgi:hypothetical protein